MGSHSPLARRKAAGNNWIRCTDRPSAGRHPLQKPEGPPCPWRACTHTRAYLVAGEMPGTTASRHRWSEPQSPRWRYVKGDDVANSTALTHGVSFHDHMTTPCRTRRHARDLAVAVCLPMAAWACPTCRPIGSSARPTSVHATWASPCRDKPSSSFL
jgi:hypothetical protein